MTTTVQELCPVLALQHNDIITKENVNSLLLSTYQRTAGTVVKLSCYVPTLYKLEGNSQVTCTNGIWAPDPGECVPIQTPDDGSNPSEENNNTTDDGGSDTYTIALIATASVCAFLLLAIVASLIFKFYCISPKKNSSSDDSLEYSDLEESRKNTYNSSPVSTIPTGGSSYGLAFHSSWPRHSETKAWTYLSVDRLLRDIETSRRDNPRHSWRDFASISTDYATRRL